MISAGTSSRLVAIRSTPSLDGPAVPPLRPPALAGGAGCDQDEPDRVVRPRGRLEPAPRSTTDVADAPARPGRRRTPAAPRPRSRSLLSRMPADVAAPGGDDVVPERELGVPAVHHVAAVRLDGAVAGRLFSSPRPAAVGRDVDPRGARGGRPRSGCAGATGPGRSPWPASTATPRPAAAGRPAGCRRRVSPCGGGPGGGRRGRPVRAARPARR